MKKSSEMIREFASYAYIGITIYLFYKSIWALTLLLPCIFFYRKIHKKDLILKYKSELNVQFKDMLESMTAALRAGYSVENAIFECSKEMKIMHGEESPIYKELKFMINQIKIGVSVENVIKNFAERSGVDDISTFSSVFSIAKRTGGDMVEILRKTSDEIGAKIDTKREIEVLVSSKKFEQRIMTLIPIGIIVYIDTSSAGLLDPLYWNPTGIVIMTLCLAAYIASIFLGRKIMNIEV